MVPSGVLDGGRGSCPLIDRRCGAVLDRVAKDDDLARLVRPHLSAAQPAVRRHGPRDLDLLAERQRNAAEQDPIRPAVAEPFGEPRTRLQDQDSGAMAEKETPKVRWMRVPGLPEQRAVARR